jgi:endo-1,4-beta-xylanase
VFRPNRQRIWDVVNEAWVTTECSGDGNPTLRDSVFSRYLGDTFIDEAFTAARAADPDAKLYYNDFSAEAMNDKADAIYQMVSGMIDRGIPIDGVGFQMHYGAPHDVPPVAEFVQNMQRFADLGLEIVISEMDMHVCDGMTPEQQATNYHDIVAACVAQPGCKAITLWGVTDRYSWLNSWDKINCSGSASPLLWDDNFQKKPAYTAVLDALTGR